MDGQSGLDVLLELDGTIAYQENGYWVAIVARRAAITANTPHGVRYSLTLHDRNGERVLGYDNAHALPRMGKLKEAGRNLPFDHWHRHRSNRGQPYAYSTAYQLLADFFREVDRVLNITRNM